MPGRAWNISTHDFVAVSFYPNEGGEGGALREQFFFLCKKGHHIDGRYLTAADKRAKKLGAKSFRLWLAVPRAFGVREEDSEA
jgi:hypothetical protein